MLGIKTALIEIKDYEIKNFIILDFDFLQLFLRGACYSKDTINVRLL